MVKSLYRPCGIPSSWFRIGVMEFLIRWASGMLNGPRGGLLTRAVVVAHLAQRRTGGVEVRGSA